VKIGSVFVSRGLLDSDVGVRMAGFGLVGSSPEGYDRGSRLALEREEILEREEAEDAMEGAQSLLPVDVVDVEKVDAKERRECNDELVEEVYDEAMELRPGQSQSQHGAVWMSLTRLQHLLEHSLYHLWGMSAQQGFNMLHGLLREILIVLHFCECTA
jgi:hypothetical protein